MNNEQPSQPSQPPFNAPQPGPAKDAGKARRIIGVILMVGPISLSGALLLLVGLLGKTPLGSDPNAAGIFLPLALLSGFVFLIGLPAFVVGIILVVTSRKR